jgi:putative glycosyltransferase (TIGR04372 family)
MSSLGLMRHEASEYVRPNRGSRSAYQIYSLWKGRAPLLRMTPADLQWGDEALRRLGLPENAWFVCVHVREGGFSPIDEELQAHRNASIEATIPAMLEIGRAGGWVIRTGDPSMKPLPPLPQVIDYAHHPMKSDRLDVILCARARFILGSTSGITLVGSIFGVPCAIMNTIPTSNLWYNSHDLSIVKLLWSEKLNRYLRFDEVLGSRLADLRYAAMYRQSGIRVDENSAQDITDLADEMMQRLDGRFIETPDDRRNAERFRSYFPSGHCTADSCARAGACFLRRHSDLLRPQVAAPAEPSMHLPPLQTTAASEAETG